MGGKAGGFQVQLGGVAVAVVRGYEGAKPVYWHVYRPGRGGLHREDMVMGMYWGIGFCIWAAEKEARQGEARCAMSG